MEKFLLGCAVGGLTVALIYIKSFRIWLIDFSKRTYVAVFKNDNNSLVK